MTHPDIGPRGFRQVLRAMFRLAVPVVTVQVGMMAMGVVDTLMVGRVSAEALAAVALGNVYFYAAAIFGMGVLLALDPVVAQAVGARDDLGVTRGLQRGVVLAGLLTVLASLLLLPVEPVLRLARQPPEVIPIAAGYALVQVTAMLPFYLFVALRQTLQAMHRTAPIVMVIVVTNVINVGLNWAFVFGHLGLPPMGAIGSSWATSISRWLMAVGLLIAGWAHLRPHLVPWRRESLHLAPLRRMVALGIPIGVQHQLEFGIFGLIGLMMGFLGAVPMAGHQVALNIASFTFMVPMGVAAAAAVLVGNAIGRSDLAEARRAAGAGLLIGFSFMVLTAGLMIGAPELLALAYTNQMDVVAVAIVLIPLAGLFQVFDGLQVVSIGILRGLADTRTPMVVNVVGFWLVGLPISAWLGLRAGLGPRGLWWGLVIGLAAVALILLVRVRVRLAGEVAPVVLDAPPARAVEP